MSEPTASTDRVLSKIIARIESHSYGNYCFEPGCVEPGIDNCDTTLRKIIAKMEKT